MDCSPPGSSVHSILQARILEWVAMPSSRGSSQPMDLLHCRQILHHLSHSEAHLPLTEHLLGVGAISRNTVQGICHKKRCISKRHMNLKDWCSEEGRCAGCSGRIVIWASWPPGGRLREKRCWSKVLKKLLGNLGEVEHFCLVQSW